MRYAWLICALFAPLVLAPSPSPADAVGEHRQPAVVGRQPATARIGVNWPSLPQFVRVATLRNYNTRLVVTSTSLLGLAAGLIGSFLLLRKRSLMGDALSHATLPGIALMFILLVGSGMAGKNLPLLLLGATVTGVLGVGLTLLIRNTSRIKDDAAMGIVLSVFFGIGAVILRMVQSLPEASAAGLDSFIYGNTASMVGQDLWIIASVAVVVAVASIALLKEFAILCFDEGFAASEGWPVHTLDVIMLSLVAAVTVAGLQAVGLILIIAFLITPAAAARFWTNNLTLMMILAGAIGGLSGWLGASISALLPRLPAGAVIVLVAAAVFVVSMVVGPARGVLVRLVSQSRLRRKIGRQHLLRAVYECLEARRHPESDAVANVAVGFNEVLAKRSWTPGRLRQLIRTARREDHIESFNGRTLRLSESGFGEAVRVTRNHRLWEIYLIEYADVAPSHVDRDADTVEHVLGADMVRELESRAQAHGRPFAMPPSPHALHAGAAP